MRISLRLKFFLAFSAVIILAFTAVATLGSTYAQKQYLKTEIENLYKDANYIAASYKVNDGNVSHSLLETMAYATSSEIWILDTQGNVLLSSGNGSAPQKVAEFNSTSGVGTFYRIGDFYHTFDQEMLSVYTTLSKNILPDGYVIIHYPIQEIYKKADASIYAAYIFFAVFFVLISLLFIYLEFFIVQPIRKTRKAVIEYSNGNLSYEDSVKNHDEIGDIAKGNKELAKQLNAGNKDQHRLLANISHDFRSPLTSIRGYLNAILDGTIPPEMQEKYLNVVLSETDRLKNLANDLLDMTQLESGIILDKSSFDINDLIRNCLPTFEGRVTEKNIEFLVTFEEESQFVVADKARIEQVLYNLVDNAIKFSSASSSIDIETSLHGDKVFVSVKDHGIGIAKSDLHKIWDRFYKTDSSRGKDKKGTGLGLAIVREIIQAHKENIDVISTPNVGTEFIFTLPSQNV